MSKGKAWAGRLLTGLGTAIFLASAISKLAAAGKMVEGLTHAGIPHSAIVPIAILELTCLVLYLVPRTAVLGTFLLTGYLGGATVTHLIGGESILMPLVVGLAILGGAYFSIPRLQSLLPFVKRDEMYELYSPIRNAQPSRS